MKKSKYFKAVKNKTYLPKIGGLGDICLDESNKQLYIFTSGGWVETNINVLSYYQRNSYWRKTPLDMLAERIKNEG